MHTFSTYHEWRAAITGPCGLTLSANYCESRIKALNDPAEPSTKAFTEAYGDPYRELVISWFEQAARNATAS
jgi:hypothetical protein